MIIQIELYHFKRSQQNQTKQANVTCITDSALVFS
jgi:hypothetical protein